jgi:hypothetical protein
MDDRTFEALKRVVSYPQLRRELKNHTMGYARRKPIGEDVETVMEFVRDLERERVKAAAVKDEEAATDVQTQREGDEAVRALLKDDPDRLRAWRLEQVRRQINGHRGEETLIFPPGAFDRI